jgi:hypothetical protein
LRIPVIQQTCAKRRAVVDSVLVRGDKVVDLCCSRFVEEDGGQVLRYFLRCCEVRREEAEERAFVFLVAYDEGYFCVFAGADEVFGGGGYGFSVGAGELGKVHCEVG